MSREIKFRAWDGQEMIPVDTLSFLAGGTRWHGPGFGEGWLGKDGSVLMQFTGLRDSEGREIYEGDIAVNERGEKGVIEFSCGAFGMRYVPPFDWDPMEPVDGMLDMCRVLGNIHEHPHLLNNEQEEK